MNNTIWGIIVAALGALWVYITNRNNKIDSLSADVQRLEAEKILEALKARVEADTKESEARLEEYNNYKRNNREYLKSIGIRVDEE
jgi:outer membrane murein-binding lipoprotein Lpp